MTVDESLQSVSLYFYSGPKALLEPCSANSAARLIRNGGCLASAQLTARGVSSQRLKFPTTLWQDLCGASVQSQKAFLDIVAAQHRRGMEYICCADLNLTGDSAGTHFFQQQPAAGDVEISCLQLANHDKIRLIRMPESEHASLDRVIKSDREWGAQRADKYGVPVYKLKGLPWFASETSKSFSNVRARKLILSILSEMDSHGWSRAVPFECTIGDYDADSIVFFRSRSDPIQPSLVNSHEFCAIALERHHKIRLIEGGFVDEKTRAVFEHSVQKHWTHRVKETNRFNESMQMKLQGMPWYPNSTEENIASARLICGILQDLWQQGWRWHCAVDLSNSVSDKSTFFLSRSSDMAYEDDMQGGQIACVQPKGKGKVNLVSFPPDTLTKALSDISSSTWATSLVKIERHGINSATCHFQNMYLHDSYNTDQKIQTANVYTQLLRIIAASAEGTTMLGTSDISGNSSSETSSSGSSSSYSLDTDAFFLWFPSA